jgi:catechol 2,3-dioxygenase-like lactoylglutathione lyase family enzyme
MRFVIFEDTFSLFIGIDPIRRDVMLVPMYHTTSASVVRTRESLTVSPLASIMKSPLKGSGGLMFKTGNVTILVSDMSKAIRFYTEVLGLKLISNYGGEFAVVESNGLRIGLHPGKKGHEKLSRDLSLGFQVEDLTSAKSTLESRGVIFEKRVQDRGAIIEYFDDPDGTPMYLIELKWG